MSVIKSLLSSRKVIVALIALAVAIADKYGLSIDPARLEQIMYIFMAVIGGIAVEDAAHKFKATPPTN